MLLDWMRKIHQLEYAHCFQSLSYNWITNIVNIWAFILSTVVAFAYRFPLIDIPFIQDVLVHIVLFIVAILTGYQSLIRPGEKSEKHRKLGLRYERIRHDIELILSDSKDKKQEAKNINSIKKEWDSLKTIYVSQRQYKKAKKKVESFKRYPKELSFLSLEEKPAKWKSTNKKK